MCEDKKELREKVIKLVESSKCRVINLDVSMEELEKIVFDDVYDLDGKFLYKKIALPNDIFRRINLKGVSFDYVNVISKDFCGCFGIVINPQTVYAKSFYNTRTRGTTINGSFDGCLVEKANFSETYGVVINPQTVKDKNLYGCDLTDAIILGSFNSVNIKNSTYNGRPTSLIARSSQKPKSKPKSLFKRFINSLNK